MVRAQRRGHSYCCAQIVGLRQFQDRSSLALRRANRTSVGRPSTVLSLFSVDGGRALRSVGCLGRFQGVVDSVLPTFDLQVQNEGGLPVGQSGEDMQCVVPREGGSTCGSST
jgi:hypothetical protein